MIPLLLLSFFVLLCLGVPIGISLGLSSLIGLVVFSDIPLVVVVQRMFVSVDSFPLLAVPLFMLAANLMGSGGISRRIIDFSSSVVGHFRGGLAQVNIFASMVFAGISGSSVADTAGIGKVVIPAMIEKKYDRGYTAAVTAISSTIGSIIPPSIPMVVIGSMVGVSVGKLFLGGIIPGILIGVIQMVIAWVIAKKAGYPKQRDGFNFLFFLRQLKRAIWALLLFIIIIGGIILGIFTPTEAGAVAVVYALVVGTFVYKELDLKSITKALWDTALSTSKVFFVISTAGLFTWILTAYGFPNVIRDFLFSITSSPTMIMILVCLIILVITTFMESLSTLTLLIPILYPIVEQVGIDPIFFGVMVVICLGVGMVTPPVGLCLYVASDISEVSVPTTTKALLPFIGAVLGIVVLLFVFPQLITFIPNVFL